MGVNLDCRYTVNGQIMGSTLKRADTFAFDIAVSDSGPIKNKHKITKIDIVKDGGVLAATHRPDPPAFSVRWKPTLTDATNRFFFVRVWNASGGDAKDAKPNNPVAWLAPVWITR
jgi:hypothetical protein